MAKEEKNQDKDVEVITAVYKVNLHCPQCACQIQKPLLRTQGVHEVEVHMERNEIRVKGRIEPKKMHERIKKLCKREVEMMVPAAAAQGKAKDGNNVTEKTLVKETKEVTVAQQKNKDGLATEKIMVKDTKEQKLCTTRIKVHLHCEKCGHDLEKKLIKNKGVYNVNIDVQAQILIVEGTIEPEKLLGYIQKKVHKHAEIITPRPEQEKEEQNESLKVETKNMKVKKNVGFKEEKGVELKIKDGEAKNIEVKKNVGFKEEKGVELKIKDGEAKNIGVLKKSVEFKEEKDEELKMKDGNNVPYFIHYAFAPQIFSDENPNACSIL
ncbi:heavy metal-associated isoprenylated plant protein 4 [Malania oleifera]|uniref:heavy metal-associated isoprenylated plant protein 4 n=1 Tax=Malania oleifera TaxID=397392 RepID=UPI0025AE0B96|nr:heavy metal-associated isoprenylated plant protein 4 [Malania oleifera]